MGDPINLRKYGEREMLDSLDAYGLMFYSLSFEGGLACAAYEVWHNVEYGVQIAYHIILDDEKANFLDVVEKEVFCIEDLGSIEELDWFPLESWAREFLDHDVYDLLDLEETKECWINDIRADVARTLGIEEGDE